MGNFCATCSSRGLFSGEIGMKPCEYTKLCAARYIYHKRDKSTPSGKHTWLDWWEQRFQDVYYDYIKRKAKEKRNETD